MSLYPVECADDPDLQHLEAVHASWCDMHEMAAVCLRRIHDLKVQSRQNPFERHRAAAHIKFLTNRYMRFSAWRRVLEAVEERAQLRPDLEITRAIRGLVPEDGVGEDVDAVLEQMEEAFDSLDEVETAVGVDGTQAVGNSDLEVLDEVLELADAQPLATQANPRAQPKVLDKPARKDRPGIDDTGVLEPLLAQ